MNKAFYGLLISEISLEQTVRTSYGIAFCQTDDGAPIIIRAVADLTTDKGRAAALVDRCNRLALSPIHLDDITEDFLAE